MILSGPEAFWGSLERRVTHSLVVWSDEAVEEYKRALFTVDAVHGASTSSEIVGNRQKNLVIPRSTCCRRLT
jgi:regulatory protein YycH of two-component signal transduction system YycFG